MEAVVKTQNHPLEKSSMPLPHPIPVPQDFGAHTQSLASGLVVIQTQQFTASTAFHRHLIDFG